MEQSVQLDGTFKDGKKNGVFTLYVDERKLSEETWKDGEADGPALIYGDNGSVSLRGQHRSGERDGLWTEFFPDGSKRSEIPYKRGDEHGTATLWDRDGDRWAEIRFERGKVQKVVRWEAGKAVPPSGLADDEKCSKLTEAAKERAKRNQLQGGIYDDQSERDLYLSCRTYTVQEVECLLSADDLSSAEECRPER